MELKTIFIKENNPEEIENTIQKHLREGWCIHEVNGLGFGASISGTTTGGINKEFVNLGFKQWAPFFITFIRLSEADKEIGNNIQIIADRLSKN